MKMAFARLCGVILALLCLPTAASGQFLPLSEHRLSGGGTTDATSSRLWVVNLWSPSHQPATRAQLLSVRPGHVAVVAQDRGVSYGAIAPAPDGGHVAFINRSALWVVRRDGTGRHRVVGPPRSPCQNRISIDSMAWAPGGQRLAYTAALEGDHFVDCSGTRHEATGTWITPLVRPVPRKVSDFSDVFGGLSWSPNARTLLVIPGFGSGAQPRGSLSTTGGLLALDVRTGRSATLLRAPSPRQVFHGRFAPVTGTLGFSLGPPFAPGSSSIWAAGTQGKHRHQLATVPGAVTGMSWSPDGRHLAIVTDSHTLRQAGIRTLWVLGAAGHRLQRLAVNADGPMLGPAWSPDSGQVAYIGGHYACHCGMGGEPLYGTAVDTVDVATGQQTVALRGGQAKWPMLQPGQFTGLAWSR